MLLCSDDPKLKTRLAEQLRVQHGLRVALFDAQLSNSGHACHKVTLAVLCACLTSGAGRTRHSINIKLLKMY